MSHFLYPEITNVLLEWCNVLHIEWYLANQGETQVYIKTLPLPANMLTTGKCSCGDLQWRHEVSPVSDQNIGQC